MGPKTQFSLLKGAGRLLNGVGELNVSIGGMPMQFR